MRPLTCKHMHVIEVHAIRKGSSRYPSRTPLEAGTNIPSPGPPVMSFTGGTHRRSLGDGTPVTYSAAHCILLSLWVSPWFLSVSETLFLGVFLARALPSWTVLLSQFHNLLQPVRACKSQTAVNTTRITMNSHVHAILQYTSTHIHTLAHSDIHNP